MSNPPAKAVIFDVGGVLIQMDWKEYDRFAVERGLPEREWLRILHQTEEYNAWQTGRGSEAEWHASIMRELRAHLGDRSEAFIEEWLARPTPRHDPNLDLAEALIGARYTVAVLSNAGPDLRANIDETLGRTILTTVTTLLVLTALLVLGGGVIRPFAFTLFVGFLAGLYSTIFVATPTILLMERGRRR